MIKIAICDDEQDCRKNVEILVRKYEQTHPIDFAISIFSSGAQLLDAPTPYDIYLLDILMPGLNGMMIATELRQSDSLAAIIFLTSSPEFALEGYGVHALDYLIKPISEEKLFKSLDHALTHRKEEQQNELLIPCNGAFQSISPDSIEYVEARQERLVFYLCNGKTIESIGTLLSLEQKLTADPHFVKPHRSYLVNMAYIQELNGKELRTSPCYLPVPIARGHFGELKKTYLSYMTSAMKRGNFQ